ncbi:MULTISPECIES: lipid-A-disaccharide synthase [unclassified Rhizobium]|uniref:lipid-A-disaccharide synthase n=1 Tax=unclassified Rhizobium TaxID=2613769 RepID=UPI000271CA9D|nr:MULTISPECIES: lipid-A-disaccharide synthase [unclassified Rhizobium]EJL57015.1 lipid-A-disaccharide synthase [Rhizobium sp. CF122]MBB3394395.1 lipid-A-disaccharide synthase [Rhizobium sp. BK060]MBB4169567.1 lipid-A-disaccharide synthase [Rhizobium sp. BK538]TCM75563.1 lipid-A-disaccharide synthase [Rhizobium sp. BK068]
MSEASLKVAIIVGEVSGDLLGADLIAALKRQFPGSVELIGVGGEGLEAQGLRSLFDFSELQVMGITQVLSKLPRLVRRIGETATTIIAAKPDVLIIVDSPDFTHRVAKRVRTALPDLPVVNYVCPSVWAWKEYRAQRMLAYVDQVLAVLPFEPEVMRKLGGPPTTYVGHRLTADPNLLGARRQREQTKPRNETDRKTVMLLPGSRSSEIMKLLPHFGDAVSELVARNGDVRFVLPTMPRRESMIRDLVKDWTTKPEIVTGAEAKWQAFAEADAAMAASGTVVLELALTGVPCISAYKTDWIIKLMTSKIKTWSAALPNLIADYAIVPEYINDVVRGGSFARWMEKLAADTLPRRAMMEGFDVLWQRMQTEKPPGEHAAEIVLDVLQKKKPGHF